MRCITHVFCFGKKERHYITCSLLVFTNCLFFGIISFGRQCQISGFIIFTSPGEREDIGWVALYFNGHLGNIFCTKCIQNIWGSFLNWHLKIFFVEVSFLNIDFAWKATLMDSIESKFFCCFKSGLINFKGGTFDSNTSGWKHLSKHNRLNYLNLEITTFPKLFQLEIILGIVQYPDIHLMLSVSKKILGFVFLRSRGNNSFYFLANSSSLLIESNT